MGQVGWGPWASEQIQHARTRKKLEQVCDEQTEPALRERLTRQLLRDGNDLVACMIMAAWQSRCPDRRWGLKNFFDRFIGPMRARAARILRGPSRWYEGLDHSLCLQVLTWNQRRRDFDILLRFADPDWPLATQRQTAIQGLARLVPWLHPAQSERLLELAEQWQGQREPHEERSLAHAVSELCWEDLEGAEQEDAQTRARIERALALLEAGVASVPIGRGGAGWLGSAAAVRPQRWLERAEAALEGLESGPIRSTLARGVEFGREREQARCDALRLDAGFAQLGPEASGAELDAVFVLGRELTPKGVRLSLRRGGWLAPHQPSSILKAALRLQYHHTLWGAAFEPHLRALLDHPKSKLRRLARKNLLSRAPWDIVAGSPAAVGERLRRAPLAEARRILDDLNEHLWMPGPVVLAGLEHEEVEVRRATIEALGVGSRIAGSPASAYPEDFEHSLSEAQAAEPEPELRAALAALRERVQAARTS